MNFSCTFDTKLDFILMPFFYTSSPVESPSNNFPFLFARKIHFSLLALIPLCLLQLNLYVHDKQINIQNCPNCKQSRAPKNFFFNYVGILCSNISLLGLVCFSELIIKNESNFNKSNWFA